MIKSRVFNYEIDKFLKTKGYSVSSESDTVTLKYQKSILKGIDIYVEFQWVPNIFIPGKGNKKCAYITVYREVDQTIQGNESIHKIGSPLTILLQKLGKIDNARFWPFVLENKDQKETDTKLLLQQLENTILPYLEDLSSKPLGFIEKKEMDKIEEFIIKIEPKINCLGFKRIEEEPKFQFIRMAGDYYQIIRIGYKLDEKTNKIVFSLSIAINIEPTIYIKKMNINCRFYYLKKENINDVFQWEMDENNIDDMMQIIIDKGIKLFNGET